MGNGYRNLVTSLSSFFFIACSLSVFSHEIDTIKLGQPIKDGQTLISAGKNFQLGFFSPNNSKYRYVGIWYYKVSIVTVVWVANRENPLSDLTGVLTIGNNGSLMVLDGKGKPLWSTNTTSVNGSTAILKDSGNLILRSDDDVGDSESEKPLWQSFSDPTDTFLPGMKVGYNLRNGENLVFTSWKNADDPSRGNYSMGVDRRAGFPQLVIWERSKPRWRSGRWNGETFTSVPTMKALYLHGFKLSVEEQVGKIYFTYTMFNSSNILRFLTKWDGSEDLLIWDEGTKKWNLDWSQPEPVNQCELYNQCGSFGSCNRLNSPICSCLQGFERKVVDEWSRGNWSGGCVRRTKLQCQRNSSVEQVKEDGFLKLEMMKLPDFSGWIAVEDRKKCGDECLKNCSCGAYAYVGGIGCMIWRVDLIDVQRFSAGGNEFYLRLADSELGGRSKLSKIVIAVSVVLGTILLSVFIWLFWKFRIKIKGLWSGEKEISMFDLSRSWTFSTDLSGKDDVVREGNQGNIPELPLFNFTCVAAATSNFSNANKLGQGGFGIVYKGKLPGGEEIAVKRLSRRSGQGLEELKTEIILISKLQHRNLVRLLGCCIQGEEKMLIYEYMPNKSLDSFIFDPAKKGQLNWSKRLDIVEGIARGLLYLHRDSRLRIIHRDLKASNILLDTEMNPKISDFGMARICGNDQNEANTNRVVGTYGYMSPEYAMEGLFSVKSDVYSFGVLLLEIVSGRRCTKFRHPKYLSNLLGYAWQLWSEDKAMEFIDSSIEISCHQSEVLRCIHVGLLCVQDSTEDRPTMSSVVLMLEIETATLPIPKQPTFTVVRSSSVVDISMEYPLTVSRNDVTITVTEGR